MNRVTAYLGRMSPPASMDDTRRAPLWVEERRLERWLLPTVADRGRLGILLLMAACFFPLVADHVADTPNGAMMSRIELVRLLLFGAIAAYLRPSRDEDAASKATLAGIATMAATAAWVAVLREDAGPYMIVTVGLALGCSVGLPWNLRYQAAAAAVLASGLGVAFAAMSAGHWSAATTNSVFAYLMSMIASVFVASLHGQQRRATSEALDRTVEAGDALRELNERLEQRVAERTESLAEANRELAAANVRLATTNRDLEAAYRELEGFTHSVSHDLRVPLRVINGLSRLALEEHGDALGDTGRGYLRRIGEAAIGLGEIGDDLLTLARVTRVPVVAEDVDLAALAREVAAERRGAEPDRNVRVHVDDHILAHGDPALLRIVLEQLLANAWKFTRSRAAAEIRVELVEEGGQAGFLVRDNGVGFDPEFAGKLFGRFERIHDDAEVEGRGIGLAIAQRIVSRHGGRIRAEGRSDHGATFLVTLPPRQA